VFLFGIPILGKLGLIPGTKGGFLAYGKSRAKLLKKDDRRVTFEDVAGVDEAKKDLEEIVEFLADPGKFQRLGGRIPRGILLVGPPGTGKTLLARAIAGEANVPFFTISGSDFVEMFVGVGASRVRDMFEQAKKNSPCIIFVDEIDAVGRNRGVGMGQGNDEREQTLNQLLVEMDGFEPNEAVILIAATNRPKVLDPALLRPGRFDRQIDVPNPDRKGRFQILKVHAKKVPLEADVDLMATARATPGTSGADLMNLVNEAALVAARKSHKKVSKADFEDAREKIQLGAEKGIVMSEDDRRLTAYHEGGHALVMMEQEADGHDPLRKVSILPRGRSNGQTLALPSVEKMSQSKRYCKLLLASLMAGRAGERLLFGNDEDITSGAVSDIARATKIARAMVTEWGFGSTFLGMVAYAGDEDEAYPGQHSAQLSETTKELIEKEVRELIQEGFNTAHTILSKRRGDLDTLAGKLLDEETLDDTQVRELLGRAVLVEPSEEETLAEKDAA
jgi:cell division protease FtsH